MQRDSIKLQNMILAAFFLALAFVLPFWTGQIPQVGAMLCPMHLPVLLCGFLCGWKWGAAIGLATPLLRSLTLGVPVLYPMAVCMALELLAYGAAAGLMHRLLPQKRLWIYASLLTAMLAGRLIFGVAMLICLGIIGQEFTVAAFLTSTVAGAAPGILLQILVIPPLVIFAEGLRKRRRRE